MKYLNRAVFVFIFLTAGFLSPEARSQNAAHKTWELGIGAGYMNYYGDLSHYQIDKWSKIGKISNFWQFNSHYISRPSIGVTLQKRLTPGIGLMLQANDGVYAMSDRYIRPDGKLMTDAPNWDRALNFKTHIIDAGAAITFRSDNGKLLKREAFFSPYIFAGAGLTYFNAKGDLLDENGDMYDYSSQNVHPDGKYETNLRPLLTERETEYSNVVPYVDFGVGFKFRLTDGISLDLQTDIKYSFSDYLDDVSGRYKVQYDDLKSAYAAHPGTNIIGADMLRGRDNGVNDYYIFNKASVRFTLGNKKNKEFKAPIVYDPGKIYVAASLQEQKKDTARIQPTSQTTTLSKTDVVDKRSKHEPNIIIVTYEDSTKIIVRNRAAEQNDAVVDTTLNRGDTIYFSPDRILQNELTDSGNQKQPEEIAPKEKVIAEVDSPIVIDDSDITMDSLQTWVNQLNKEKMTTDASEDFGKDSTYLSELKYSLDSLNVYQRNLSQQYAQLVKITGNVEDSLNANRLRKQTDSLQRVLDSLQFSYVDISLRRYTMGQQSAQSQGLKKVNEDSLKVNVLQEKIDSLSAQQSALSSQLIILNNERAVGKNQKKKLEEDRKALQRDILQQQRFVNEHHAEVKVLQERLKETRRQNEINNKNVAEANRNRELLLREYKKTRESRLVGANAGKNGVVLGVSPVIIPESEKVITDTTQSIQEPENMMIDSLKSDTVAESDSISALLQNQLLNNEKQLDVYQKQIADLQGRVNLLENKLSSAVEEKPVVEKQETAPVSIPVINIYFRVGSSKLDEVQLNKLPDVANAIRRNPNLSILLKSYTDGTGSLSVNKKVARDRSNSVKSALISQFGIDADKILIENPGISSDSTGSNALDRRVDIRLIVL